MRRICTAILYLRDTGTPIARELVEAILRPVRGVKDVEFTPSESVVTVDFDADQTCVAEIVRLMEDLGSVITSVAQRPIAVAANRMADPRSAHRHPTAASEGL